MRYLIQLIVMLTDLVIIVACAYVFAWQPLNPLIWLLIYITFKTWSSQGEFMAWQPQTIKQFLANARKYGL